MATLMNKSVVISSSLWLMIGTFFNNVIAFAVFAYVARVVDAGEIGSVLLAVIFVDIGRLISFGGIPEALIQRKQWSSEVGSSCFWFNMAMAGGITILALLLVVPLLYVLVGDTAAKSLAMLASLYLIDAARAVHVSKLRLGFNYHKLARRGFVANTIAGLCAVVLAAHGFGYLALVFQRIVQGVIATVTTWAEARWMPAFRIDWSQIAEVRALSGHVTIGKVLEFANTRVPDILVGTVMGPAALAVFRVGARCLELGNQVLLQPIQDVALSTFSRDTSATETEQDLKSALTITSMILFPAFIGAGAIADDLVILVFGDKWAASGPVMTLLCLAVVPILFIRLFSSLLMSRGKGRALVALQIVGLGAGVVFVALGLPFGVVGAAAGSVLAGYATLIWVLRRLGQELAIAPRDLLRSLLPALTSAALMFSAVILFGRMVDIHTVIIAVPAKVTVGAAAYLISLILFFPTSAGVFTGALQRIGSLKIEQERA